MKKKQIVDTSNDQTPSISMLSTEYEHNKPFIMCRLAAAFNSESPCVKASYLIHKQNLKKYSNDIPVWIRDHYNIETLSHKQLEEIEWILTRYNYGNPSKKFEKENQPWLSLGVSRTRQKTSQTSEERTR